MRGNKELHEDPDVSRTVQGIKTSHNFGAALPMVSPDVADAFENLGCLDGKMYSLLLMRMYGRDGFGSSFQEKDFPADVYDAWAALEDADTRQDPASFILASGNMLALKMMVVDFIRSAESGYFSAAYQSGNAKILEQVAHNIEGVNKKALQEKIWRKLPEQLAQSYLSAATELADCVVDKSQRDRLRVSVDALRHAIAEDKNLRPVDIPSTIDPDSKYAKLKQKSGKRFKL